MVVVWLKRKYSLNIHPNDGNQTLAFKNKYCLSDAVSKHWMCVFLVLKVQALTVKKMECFHLLSTSGNCNRKNFFFRACNLERWRDCHLSNIYPLKHRKLILNITLTFTLCAINMVVCQHIPPAFNLSCKMQHYFPSLAWPTVTTLQNETLDQRNRSFCLVKRPFNDSYGARFQ